MIDRQEIRKDRGGEGGMPNFIRFGRGAVAELWRPGPFRPCTLAPV